MNHSVEYERYIEKELACCDSHYAFCQEVASLITSEMIELERRQEQLLVALKRLREARELFLQEPSVVLE